MNLEQARKLYVEVKTLSLAASETYSDSYNTETKQAELLMPDPISRALLPIAVFTVDCPIDDRRLIGKAPLYIRALLFLLRRAFDEIDRLKARLRELAPAQHEKETDASRNDKRPLSQIASIRCKTDGRLRRFLIENYGLPFYADERALRQLVREQLDITSFTELNKPEAAERWRQLDAQFWLWMKGH